MKVLSMYLPQFHNIPENDAWWGKGFTDWVSTKKGRPLFSDHNQPHIPLSNNYYNLLDKETMKWQTELMEKYGVDGQCFYHYWFKDGRRVLEKPAENLLKWSDINMPFCFCWANETWARSWSGLRTFNTWSDNDEPVKRESQKAILLEQQYGDEEDWKKHFDYLLPFFLDKRYIRYEEMPILLIYRSSEIYCLEDMIDCFNQLALKNGLKGIYFICANSANRVPQNVNALLIHEPQNSMRQLNAGIMDNNVKCLDYEKCWHTLLQSRTEGIKTYFEGFVGYDDTPRRGINGTVILGSTPEIFEINMKELLAKSEFEGNEFVFINAWNEWGEGMHLEPDEKWNYGYLESLKRAKENYKSSDYNLLETKTEANINFILQQKEKFELYLNTLDDWITNREKGKSLVTYFEKRGYKKIAIYGYSLFARHMIFELRYSSVKIVVVIDKQRDKIACEIPVILPEEQLPEVDIIVVTSFYYMDEIKSIYASQKQKMISIENIIKEI